MTRDIIHWQWIHYQNYQQLGYSDDDCGCLLVEKQCSNGETKRRFLSHDDEFDDFFAVYNINPVDVEGIFEVNDLSNILENKIDE